MHWRETEFCLLNISKLEVLFFFCWVLFMFYIGKLLCLLQDYNCNVEFVRAPFLVQEREMPFGNGSMKDTHNLDVMDNFAPNYKKENAIIFNTGRWWSHGKTS